MSVVVFLGPSLPRSRARAVLPDAIYLPPAAQMDLMSAVSIYKPTAIALIDGVFERVPSVWHKEILHALECGVPVFGASSMGALRVAETAAFGARGVGQIFRMYAEGELLDDDEVALAHAGEEFGFRPLSEPMVNVRATLAAALALGQIDRDLHDRLIGVAKRQHFTGRSWGSIVHDPELELGDEARALLESTFKAGYVDQKAQDALELLTLLTDRDQHAVAELDFTLAHSTYYSRQLRRERQMSRKAGRVTLERIASHYALHGADFEEMNMAALNVTLANLLAGLLEFEVSPEDVAKEERRLRLYLRVKEADLENWLADNDLDREEYQHLIRQRATCRALHRWMNGEGYRGTKQTTALLHELRARGHYPRWAEAAAEHEANFAREHPDFPQPEDFVEDLGGLVIEHLRATPCRMPLPFEDWAKEAGFLYDDALRLELIKARLMRQADRRLYLSLAQDQA